MLNKVCVSSRIPLPSFENRYCLSWVTVHHIRGHSNHAEDYYLSVTSLPSCGHAVLSCFVTGSLSPSNLSRHIIQAVVVVVVVFVSAFVFLAIATVGFLADTVDGAIRSWCGQVFTVAEES